MQLSRARELLRQARQVLAITGAGISAESGVPTFRGPDGWWRKYRAEELATPEAFAANPALVWEWYNERRVHIASCQFNPAHLTLAKWEKRFPRFAIITQNVDGLHQQAGSQNVIALHGNIWEMRCTRENRLQTNREVPLAKIPPHCSCGALFRPNIVWFGETLPADAWAKAQAELSSCQVLLVIGTSAIVYPVAEFPLQAKEKGATVIEINPTETPLSELADISLRGPAGKILSEIANGL